MRKCGQGFTLIAGGCVGLVGFIAQACEREWALAALVFFGTAAAFVLGVWLVRAGKREEDSQNVP
jgi:hypothetical protein